MSVREQMLTCSACGGLFLEVPDSMGLDFCSQECSDRWWQRQEDQNREAENGVTMTSQCPHSLIVDGINQCCQMSEGHDSSHVTSAELYFTDAESWLTIEEREFAERLSGGKGKRSSEDKSGGSGC